MKKNLFFLLLAFQVIFFAACEQKNNILKDSSPSAAGMSADRLARIDTLLSQYVDSGWIAGSVGFIARDGKIVYNKAIGVSDIDTKDPLQKDDIFRIASQTKAITSIAVMILFEEGKLLLDDPVSKYIPEFKRPVVLETFNEKDSTFTTVPANREIRIRDLLTHTSGIDYAGIGSKNMNAIYSKADIPTGFVSDKILLADKIKALGSLPLVHQPGARFTYGLNTDVLGYLVEVLSGQSLDQFFRTRIFGPLGMNDTWFYLPQTKADRLVKVNTEDKDRNLITVSTDFTNYPLSGGTYYSGGAGLSSTVKDYGIFLQMLLNKGEYNGNRILSGTTVDLITSNQIGDLFLGKNKFGLGFEITTAEGKLKLGVSEGTFSWGGYFGTTYWADPEERLVCLLFIQQSPLRHGEIQDKFKSLVYQALED